MGFVDYDDEDRLEAACTLQAWFRSLRAREQVRTLARSVYERIYDEGSRCWYYRNVLSGETSWTKPALLMGDDVLTPRARRRFEQQESKRKRGALRKADDMTETEAAQFIQNLFRTRAARKRLKLLVASVYQKAFDDEGNVFYYNTRTGESSWDKPAFLGTDDLDDILDFEQAREQERDKLIEHFGKYKTMEESAAQRAEEGLLQVQRFLAVHNLEVLYDRLVEEGFDDMSALAAIQMSDIQEMGVKLKFREPLYTAVLDYRVENNLSGPLYGEDEDDENTTDLLGGRTGTPSSPQGKGKRGRKNRGDGREEDDGDDDDSDILEEGKTGRESKFAGDGDEDFPIDEEEYSEEKSVDEESVLSYLDTESVTCEDDLDGIELERVFPGDGQRFPRKGQFAMVHYVASLDNGTVFESSRKRGRPFDFLVGGGHVIPAWDKAVRLMSRGERINLRVQPHMAYGETGRPPVIPPDAILRFEIELIDTYFAPVGQLIDDEDLEDEDEDNEILDRTNPDDDESDGDYEDFEDNEDGGNA